MAGIRRHLFIQLKQALQAGFVVGEGVAGETTLL